jgi:hypothetical protein
LYFAGGFTWLLLERWLTSAVVLGVLFRSAQMLTTAPASALQDWTATGANTLWRPFSILLFLILNFEVAGFFYDYERQARFAAGSVLWTLFAAALMALGFRSSQPSFDSAPLVFLLSPFSRSFSGIWRTSARLFVLSRLLSWD